MNKPDFLTIGAIVKVQGHWHGQVADVTVTEAGRVMVLIASPKGIWRNHPAEWLEYQEGQIVPATPAEALRNLADHRRLIQAMLARLDDMEQEWRSR